MDKNPSNYITQEASGDDYPFKHLEKPNSISLWFWLNSNWRGGAEENMSNHHDYINSRIT